MTGRRFNYGRPWRRVRDRVLWRDRRICAYCGGPANTVDHVRPIVEGGARLDPANLVACCARCNSKRGGELTRARHPGRTPASPRRVTFGALRPEDLP